MILPLHKGKGERRECSNYIDISLLSMAEKKIYARILEDRICRVIGILIDDEQGCFRAERR